MSKKTVNKNLQHGYIFLGSILLLCFISSFGLEMYLKGNLPSIRKGKQEVTKSPEATKKDDEFILQLENIKSGYETTDETITIVGITQIKAENKINEKPVPLDDQNKFEKKIDLIVGKNIVVIQGYLNSELQKEITLEIFRKEKAKEEPKDSGNDQKTTPPSTPQKEIPKTKPVPSPSPKPTPTPTPSPITGLKMSCSINNTYPSVGQSVTISCSVKDQNEKAVQGATGFANISWQSGSALYNLSSSNSSGAMSTSFTVPNGNKGAISGVIKVSKSGLTVTSNFTLNVQ